VTYFNKFPNISFHLNVIGATINIFEDGDMFEIRTPNVVQSYEIIRATICDYSRSDFRREM